tara:strand:- start:848 stop:1114 length:267 start_codon:yes stop_codon:yes gene_type:complete
MNLIDQRFKEINKAKNQKYNNMNITQEQSDQNNLKSELIADLIATTTVMEELWRYHPENQEKKDVVSEYNILKQIKVGIEQELVDSDK